MHEAPLTNAEAIPAYPIRTNHKTKQTTYTHTHIHIRIYIQINIHIHLTYYNTKNTYRDLMKCETQDWTFKLDPACSLSALATRSRHAVSSKEQGGVYALVTPS